MNRRFIVIAIVGILVLAGIGGGLFWASKQNQKKSKPSPTLQIKKILDYQVISPISSLTNDAIWYFNGEGRLFRANLDGTGVSEFALPTLTGNLRSVIWPKSGSDFLATALTDRTSTSTGPTEFKAYYNSTSKLYDYLSTNIQSIDWLPDGQRVVYVWKSTDNVHQSLVLSNADGNGFKTIANVFWPDLQVKASPDGKSVLLIRSRPAGDTNKIYLADIASGQISTIVDQGKNVAAFWVPNSNKFIYAQNVDSAYPRLFLYDIASKVSSNLNLNTSLDRVIVSADQKYLYAAVPKKDNTGDTFIKEDLTTFQQQDYFQPLTPVRANSLLLLGNTLYFISLSDGKLYSIEQ